MAYNLENNPLFNNNEQETKAKPGRPAKADVVKGNSVQEGLTADYTRATFILKVDHVEKIKDYAYTERLSLKDALEKLLGDALANIEEQYKAEGKELLSRKGANKNA